MWSPWVLLVSIAVLVVLYWACSDGLFASPDRVTRDQEAARRAAQKRHVDGSDEDRRLAIEDARELRAHRRLRQLGFLLVIIPAIAQLLVITSVTLLTR